MSHRIIRLKEVKQLTGLSRSSIYLKISEKKFPFPIKLGARAVGWVEEEIEDWINLQIEQSGKKLRGDLYV